MSGVMAGGAVAALVALVMGTYVRTLFPSVPGGDSGELMAEGCQLGVAHPPGYPLFVLVAKAAVTVFPWGSPAFRINLLSAASDTAAAALICSTVMLLSRRSRVAPAAGFLAGAMFAFAPLIWLYAVGAEVFSVNNFFAALIVWQTVRVAKLRRHRDVCLGALLCGLATCNQHTIILFEAPLIVFLLWSFRSALTPARVAAYAGSFFAGMLPYIYVPLTDSLAKKRGSWGDSSTLGGFLRHFLRKDYGTFRLYARDTAGPFTLERIQKYASNMALVQLPPFVAVLVLVGLVACAVRAYVLSDDEAPADSGKAGSSSAALVPPRATSGIARALVATYVFYLVVFHFLANMPLDDPLLFGVHARFWQQPHVLACVFLGVGVVEAVAFAQRRMDGRSGAGDGGARRSGLAQRAREARGKGGGKGKGKGKGKDGAPDASAAQEVDAGSDGVGSGIATVVTAVCVLLVAWQVQRSFFISDHSTNRYLETYMRTILEPLPPNSIFMSGYDQQWTVGRYLQDCEGLRPDVVLLNGPVASYDWFQAQRHLYPSVNFTGTHLVGANTKKHAAGGFSLKEFFNANVDQHGIYVAGRPVFSYDDTHLEAFDEVPAGLVKRVVRKGRTPTSQLLREAMAAWDEAERRMVPDLADPVKYDKETWESTTRIDFWANAQTTGEWVLETALALEEGIDFEAVVFAARLLEDYVAHAEEAIAPQFYKNLGLAYARFVQGQGKVPDGTRLSAIPGLPANPTLAQWKEAASLRVLDTWTTFINLPDARKDSAYPSIKSVVDRLNAAAQRRSSPGAAPASGAQAGSKPKRQRRATGSKKRSKRD